MKWSVTLLFAAVVAMSACGKNNDKGKGKSGSPGQATKSQRANARITQVQVKSLAREAFALWSSQNNKACPKSAAELARAVGKSDVDAFGHKLIVRCGDNAPPNGRIGIVSVGADGKLGTADDIKSWQ